MDGCFACGQPVDSLARAPPVFYATVVTGWISQGRGHKADTAWNAVETQAIR